MNHFVRYGGLVHSKVPSTYFQQMFGFILNSIFRVYKEQQSNNKEKPHISY